jgi:hypothetical protein
MQVMDRIVPQAHHHQKVTKFYFRPILGTDMAVPEISLKTRDFRPYGRMLKA